MNINKCGCDGKGDVVEDFLSFKVECQNCGASTSHHGTEQYAIEAWNKANPSESEIRKDQTGKILNKLNTTFNEYLEIRDKHTVPEAQNFWEAQASAIGREIDKIKKEFGG